MQGRNLHSGRIGTPTEVTLLASGLRCVTNRLLAGMQEVASYVIAKIGEVEHGIYPLCMLRERVT